MSAGNASRAAIVAFACLGIYIGAYLFLCLRDGDDTNRYGGTDEHLFLRAYRWSWCEVAFAPAARVESGFRHRYVVIVADPSWCPRPWWAWWPIDE